MEYRPVVVTIQPFSEVPQGLSGDLGVWKESQLGCALSLPGQGWLSWNHNIYMEELWSSCVYPSIVVPTTRAPNLLHTGHWHLGVPHFPQGNAVLDILQL